MESGLEHLLFVLVSIYNYMDKKIQDINVRSMIMNVVCVVCESKIIKSESCITLSISINSAKTYSFAGGEWKYCHLYHCLFDPTWVYCIMLLMYM